MKLKNVSFLGALLLAVAGGCAHVRSTAFSYQPVSNGKAVDVYSYDLNVGGQAGGRVVFMPAKWEKQPGRDLIIVPLRVDNNSDREFRLPTAQLNLTTNQATLLPPVEIDGSAVPDTIIVQPGQSRTFQVAFPQPMPQNRRGQLLVAWALAIDGAQPITRVTPFTPYVAEIAAGNPTAAELPALQNPRALRDGKPYYDGVVQQPQQVVGQAYRARAFPTSNE